MSAGSGAAALGGGATGVPWPGLGLDGALEIRLASLTIGISSSWFGAHREVGPEPVPRGERRHRDAVEPRDRVGGLAGLDPVAHRVDQRLGLAVLERVRRRARAGAVDRRRGRSGLQPSGWVLTPPVSSPAAGRATSSGRSSTSPARRM